MNGLELEDDEEVNNEIDINEINVNMNKSRKEGSKISYSNKLEVLSS